MFVGGNDRRSTPTTVARYHPLGNCINAQQSGNSSLKTPQFTSISEILRCCLATVLTHGELSSATGIVRIKCAHENAAWVLRWAIVYQIQWAIVIFFGTKHAMDFPTWYSSFTSYIFKNTLSAHFVFWPPNQLTKIKYCCPTVFYPIQYEYSIFRFLDLVCPPNCLVP